MKTLKDKIKSFPDSPGVYRFIGAGREILYIGRATSLKKRVSQYFRRDVDRRIGEMVSLARDVKYVATDNVLDAIVLEANEIKKHWPKYNIRDKDNKSFSYVIIPKKDFSYPFLVRGQELKKFPTAKNLIFGPYQSQSLLKNALKIIRRIFPYGTCQPGIGRPCFDRQIGLCPGACVGEISAKDYAKNIRNIALLLSGEKKKLLAKLKKDNLDQAKALAHIQDVTLITRDELAGIMEVNRIEAYDISHFAGKETYGSMAVFVAGEADKKEYRLFKIKEAPAGDDLRALAETLIRRLAHGEWALPDIFLIDGGKPQVDFIAKIFAKENISTPLIGLSKLAGDKLVYRPATARVVKDLAESIKPVLVKARDEAHRFGNRGRKSGLRQKTQNRYGNK